MINKEAARTRQRPAPLAGGTGRCRRSTRRSAEGVAARAGTARVGVVDREALLLDGVDEVDRRATEVRTAHAVDDDLDATEFVGLVPVEEPLVEEQLVPQAGTAARLDGDAQPQVVAALLVQQRLHLRGGRVAEHDASDAGGPAEGRGVLHRHVCPPKSESARYGTYCRARTSPRRLLFPAATTVRLPGRVPRSPSPHT